MGIKKFLGKAAKTATKAATDYQTKQHYGAQLKASAQKKAMDASLSHMKTQEQYYAQKAKTEKARQKLAAAKEAAQKRQAKAQGEQAAKQQQNRNPYAGLPPGFLD